MKALPGTRRVLLLVAVLALSAVALPAPVAASAAPQTELAKIIGVAQSELGSRYAFASAGPNTFDCSGFVTYVYRKAGLLDRIGSRRRTVAGYHQWFSRHSTVTRGINTAQPGDLLIWGRNHHIGIYVGDNKAISALINPWGVKLHRVDRISLKLKYVLHVKLKR